MEKQKNKKNIFKKIFKIFAGIVIASVYIIILARIFVMRDSPIADKVVENEAIVSLCQTDGKVTIERYEITDFYRNVNEGSYLGLSDLYYIPQTDNMQFTIKYNTDIADAPNEQDIPFKLYLTDEDANVYTEYEYITDTRFNYGYIRVCFDGIELIDEGTELDEQNDPLRKNYELYIERKNENGEYEEFYSFSLYTGRKGNKKFEYTPK
jgi:hypothetical protein